MRSAADLLRLIFCAKMISSSEVAKGASGISEVDVRLRTGLGGEEVRREETVAPSLVKRKKAATAGLNLSCEWYKRCLAKHLPGCADDDKEYAVNYGYKFCSAFTEQANTFSARGKLWIEKTKLCLQSALVRTMEKPTSNCTIVRADAFDSHPECYVNPDLEDPTLGICNLVHTSPSDVFQILRITRSALFSAESAKQIVETAQKCGFKWITG